MLPSSDGGLQGGEMETLRIYGPGGPYRPMSECALAFGRAGGCRAEVTKGTPQQWLVQARSDADLIYGGAEYMLDEFIADYPGFLDPETRTNLYARRIGVIVRKGNPRQINNLADLSRPRTKILNVELEKMAVFQERPAGLRTNINLSVLTGEEGAEKWLTDPALDAWITYESWHVPLRDETDFILLPGEGTIYRHTPVAITAFSRKKELAKEFIAFLKSPAGREIFCRWGWTTSPGRSPS